MEPLFTWVHLSDLHMGHGDAAHGWDQRLVLQTLLRDLRTESHQLRVDAIFVTGDVVFSGKAAQYAEARSWLDEVARVVGLDARSVFVVPGNHDVDRSADRDRDTARLLRTLRTGEETIDTALAHGPDREKLAARMAAYLDFAAGLAPACRAAAMPSSAERLFWQHRDDRGQLRLRILGLNTSLLAADDQDQGHLAVGKEQLGLTLAEAAVEPDELVIALSHHPLQGGWLADEKEVAGWLRKHAHVHLFGHIHDASSEDARSGAGGRWVCVAAGAAHAEPQPDGGPSGHGYTVGSVLADSDGNLSLRLWPRRWSQRHKSFVLDVDNVPDGLRHAEHRLGLVLPEASTMEFTAELTLEPRGVHEARLPARATRHSREPVPPPDPLARALDDALARKQRLEAAGLSVADVLDDIRKLKRELRRGGVLRPGDVLGHHYLLAEQIGQGGFGTVWRARDRRTDEDVAIKVLHPNLAGDPERRQRFFRGARIMTELAHPAVVRIRQLEAEDDGFHYFVMDYLPGGNLHDAVLAGRLKPEQFQALILQVGAALAAAHEQGIVHRDVKPSNILLDDEGRAYLTDFDLVTAPDTTGGTRTGAMGTFLYAPPEMLERPQEADARTDVYGLGMTLAFMLNGKPLPHDSVRDASRFVQALACTAQWQRVLARAVSWFPDYRFADAGEFCQAVHAATGPILPIEAVSESSGNTLTELLDEIVRGSAIDYPILVSYREPQPGDAAETLGGAEHRDTDERLRNFLQEHATSEIFLLRARAPVPGGKHPVTIGRGRDCDVRLSGGSVSRVHAEVRFDRGSGDYHIVDCGSRHGTYLDGDVITPGESMPLSPWSIVSIGEAVFWFVEPMTLNRLARRQL